MVAKPAGTCRIQPMINTKTYTAEYHDKTMDFRVVRWTPMVDGIRMGTNVDRFDTEQEAMEVSRILNQAEDLSLYLDQSCEFDT